MIRPLLLAALLLAAPAPAAERRVGLGSFDRVRVAGPFEVTHRIGSPGATVSGDRETIERIELRLDGATLTVRMGGQGWGERPAAARTAPVVVTLSSPTLGAASVAAGGRLTVERLRGARVDLAVSGTGALAAVDVVADEVAGSVVGAGELTLGGKAGRVRLVNSGPGKLDAEKLVAHELFVAADGTGETRAAARYAAQVTNGGLGGVTVVGRPKCRVTSKGGGPVRCGE